MLFEALLQLQKLCLLPGDATDSVFKFPLIALELLQLLLEQLGADGGVLLHLPLKVSCPLLKLVDAGCLVAHGLPEHHKQDSQHAHAAYGNQHPPRLFPLHPQPCVLRQC